MVGRRDVRVLQVRLAPGEVEAAAGEVRRLAGDRRVTWWVGDRATPADVCERLEGLGLRRDQDLAGMVLDGPPAGVPRVEARRVAGFDEYVAAHEIEWESFATPAAERERVRASLSRRWETDGGLVRMFVALDRGEVIAFGRAHFGEHAVILSGGATRAGHRGRGAYTALVHARWCEAVEGGTPLLIVQAAATSEPVLTRLGFRRTGAVTVYTDTL